MERETKITNTEGQKFKVIENHMGKSVFVPQMPELGHTTPFERVLEADLENAQGEDRGYPLSPEELLARDE